MPNYQAITRERHAHQHWQRPATYAFAATETVASLSLSELPKAVMSLPICFIAQGEAFAPVAVLGLLPGKNLFVAPDGHWATPYVPATLRSYPFRMGQTEAGEQVLCIDEDSGLVTADAGERFFTVDGSPAAAALEVLNTINQDEQNRLATVVACATLQKHQLIRPWPITLQTESGERKVEGLFQVDETALNQLPPEALHEVRQSGALLLAYCQLLSMQHLSLLSQLNDAHQKAAAQAAANQQLFKGGSLNLDFLGHSDTMKFN